MLGEYKIVTTSRVVWTLPSPCNWVEVEKVFAQIRMALPEDQRWDDTVEVAAHDDEIHISYEVEMP